MAKPMEKILWQEIEAGSVVTEIGNAREYETGSWRSERPVVNAKECIKCGVCWLFCPDSCVRQAADGHFEADLTYCKGCGICARECPTGCIKMIAEEG